LTANHLKTCPLKNENQDFYVLKPKAVSHRSLGRIAFLAIVALLLAFTLAIGAFDPSSGYAAGENGETVQAEPKPGQAEPKHSLVALDLGLAFVLIKPGTFKMGAEPRLERFTSYALPKHEAKISKPFYMGRFEVTQSQWMAIMGRNPSRFKGAGLPVDSVTWDKAQEFVDKLNEKEGRRIFRLPTEAEWEYAARAGTDTVYPFGNAAQSLGDYAWYTNNSDLTTHPVGLKTPNPWGIHDLLGNVREWTSDWMGPYPSELDVDPKGPSTGTERVARGGAFNFIDVNCGVSRRVGYLPGSRQNFLGLRLVMDLEEDSAE
jgi:formylglycine-generating enzyme required for sulfatase activity